MAAHIVCIHGIGVHANDWVQPKKKADATEDSFGDLFAKLWKKYPALKGDLDDAVEFHSVHYDDELDNIFDSWDKQVQALKDGLASSPLLQGQVEWFTDAMDQAAAAKKQSHWAYTCLMDLLLFVGSPSIQDRLVTYVGKQLIDIIAEHQDEEISLIAHSMGCAMTHKVIQALFNEVADGKTLKKNFRFENVCMVANTSYSLSRDRANHYSGIVRPSLSVGTGCCYTWINVNHRLDPVGQFQRFDYRKNPAWLDPKIEQRGWHKDITTSRISSPQIHSLNHYFLDPALHIPYFELVLGAKFAAADRDAAIDAFARETPEALYKSLKAHLETIDTSKLESFKEFFATLQTYLGLMKQFAP